MNLIIDASVACKWYLNETGSDQARRIAADDDIFFLAPDLLIAELGNVLWKRVRVGDIGRDQAIMAIEAIGDVVPLLVPCHELKVAAVTIAMDLDHPVYDCFYLALAERWDTKLLTADRRLIQRLPFTPWASRLVALQDYPIGP